MIRIVIGIILILIFSSHVTHFYFLSLEEIRSEASTISDLAHYVVGWIITLLIPGALFIHFGLRSDTFQQLYWANIRQSKAAIYITWLLMIFYLFLNIKATINSLRRLELDYILISWLPLTSIAIFLIIFSLITKPKSRKWRLSTLSMLLMGVVSFTLLGISTLKMSEYQSSCFETIAPNALLQYCNFDGKDLSDRDLHGADLTGASFRQANLERANLSNANLTNANLINANLNGALLDRAILDSANLQGVIGLTDDILANILNVPKRALNFELTQKEIRLESRDSILAKLVDVCYGKGVNETAIYTSKGRFHPLVLLDSNGNTHAWTDLIPKNWEPMATRFCELVIRVGEIKTLRQTCSYTGGSKVRRYRYQMDVKVIAARTGLTIADWTFYGTAPDGCPPTIPLTPASGTTAADSRIIGDHVEFNSEIQVWLQKFVNPIKSVAHR